MTKGGKGGFLGENEEKEDAFWEKGGPFSYQVEKRTKLSSIIKILNGKKKTSLEHHEKFLFQ